MDGRIQSEWVAGFHRNHRPVGIGILNVTQINRKEAASGRVSYGDPVVLHETRKSRVTLVPYFIPHSGGHTELSVKLVSYTKAPPPHDWAVNEEKSLNLDGAASAKLLKALKDHLAVAEQSDDGSYLLLKVSEGTADIGVHDPQMVAKALAKVLSRKDIVQHLDGADLSDELVDSLRGAIRLREMQSAVADLREKLDRGETDEQIYQVWCQTHS